MNDNRIQIAEDLLTRIRPRFYGEDLTELEMLLRTRYQSRVEPFGVFIVAVLFFSGFMSGGSAWVRWALGAFVILTFLEHYYYRKQRRKLDMAISLFVERSPKTLDDIRDEKEA